MTPESASYLDKARKLLSSAAIALRAGLTEDAGRSAYLAAFHAAQALIFERTGRVAKTHNGVHAEFFRLTQGLALDPEQRLFLSRAYDLTSIADYEVGSDGQISDERAAEAVAAAATFVTHLADLLAVPDAPA